MHPRLTQPVFLLRKNPIVWNLNQDIYANGRGFYLCFVTSDLISEKARLMQLMLSNLQILKLSLWSFFCLRCRSPLSLQPSQTFLRKTLTKLASVLTEWRRAYIYHIAKLRKKILQEYTSLLGTWDARLSRYQLKVPGCGQSLPNAMRISAFHQNFHYLQKNPRQPW